MRNERELVELSKKIENDILYLCELVRSLKLFRGNVAQIPVAKISEDGIDGVYEDINEIQLTRTTQDEALAAYIDAVKIQKKSTSLSTIGARRSVGYIHLIGSDAEYESIRNLIAEINQDKLNFRTDLVSLHKKQQDRQAFYARWMPEVLPLTLSRKIACNDAQYHCKSVYFSWLVNGFNQETITYDHALFIIRNRVAARVRNTKSLTFDADYDVLYQAEVAKLGGKELVPELIYRRPSKINPRLTKCYMIDSTPTNMPPERASLPLLIMQREPLTKYHSMDDFQGKSSIRKVNSKKTSQHFPLIPEFGLFKPQ